MMGLGGFARKPKGDNSEVAVREWLKSGMLGGYRLPGKAGYRIQKEDLEQFLAARRKRTAMAGDRGAA
jgi:excisionase family DNA binding protein